MVEYKNDMRTYYIEAKIDYTQQDNKCRLCGDRGITIKLMISYRIKLVQREHKSRHDWVVMVIHRELCKKLKFDNATNS